MDEITWYLLIPFSICLFIVLAMTLVLEILVNRKLSGEPISKFQRRLFTLFQFVAGIALLVGIVLMIQNLAAPYRTNGQTLSFAFPFILMSLSAFISTIARAFSGILQRLIKLEDIKITKT